MRQYKNSSTVYLRVEADEVSQPVLEPPAAITCMSVGMGTNMAFRGAPEPTLRS